MDYILFGMGFGASLMLIGWALRTFGPGWKYAEVTSEETPELLVKKRFWNRFVQGLGGVLAITGTGTVLLTFLVMLSNPDDDTGTVFSLVVWLFVSLIILGWCLVYLSHFGSTGIWSRDEGYGFGAIRGFAVATPSSGRRSPRSAPVVVASIPQESEADVVVAAEPEEAIAEDDSFDLVDEDDLVAEIDADPDTEFDPAYDFGDADDVTVPPEPVTREIDSHS